MKFPSFVASVCVALSAFTVSGCAVFTKGRTQTVTITSTPSGAATSINGTPVGRTPFTVELKRSDVYRLDFEKEGFAPESTLILPSSEQYEQRYLRWGVDYQLGAVADLLPDTVHTDLKPGMAALDIADRYQQMTAQIDRADAMRASGQLTASDHKYLVDQIIATYSKIN